MRPGGHCSPRSNRKLQLGASAVIFWFQIHTRDPRLPGRMLRSKHNHPGMGRALDSTCPGWGCVWLEARKNTWESSVSYVPSSTPGGRSTQWRGH